MRSIKELQKEIDTTKNCFNYNSENRKRPFKCLFCEKNYTSRGIDRHLSYVHGIVRFDFGIREARIETLKEVLELIDDVDLELMFTDIKDKQGNKIEQSDELMELFGVFWNYIQNKLKERITEDRSKE